MVLHFEGLLRIPQYAHIWSIGHIGVKLSKVRGGHPPLFDVDHLPGPRNMD